MYKGNLIFTNDVNKLPMYCANHIIVIMAEDIELSKRFNGLMATILLPGYDACEAEMNNNPDGFYSLYYQQLNGYEANSYIATLLKGLCMGKNICVYVNPDTLDLLYFNAFLQYLETSFGIHFNMFDTPSAFIGNPSNPDELAPEFTVNLLTILIQYDLITPTEFFIAYPSGYPILQMALPKLIQLINLPLMNSEQEYIAYLTEYKERIKMNNNQFLQSGVVFGGN